MPTGYTESVATGEITTLKQFALRCARGMGACITMRDDPWDAPIPEQFEPNTKFHQDRLAKARAQLAEVDALTDEECEARAASSFKAAMASYEQKVSEQDLINRRYETMLGAVDKWHTEADGLKDFMCEQLRISMESYGLLPPFELDGKQWRERTRREALHDISYSEKAIEEEVSRTAARNIWLKDLRRSLPEDV